jgi:hypothetical protein
MRQMQKAECRRQNDFGGSILHSAFCILHSAAERRP